MGRARSVVVVAVLVLSGSACRGDPGEPTDAASHQCPGSVVRRVDGGDPTADALPNAADSATDPERAMTVSDEDRSALMGRYDAISVELADGFGRAWTGENGGSYEVVDVQDFGIVVTLRSIDDCPADSALHVRSPGGLPLFFFGPP